MEKKKSLGIILNIVFIPLIIFFSLGIIGFIGKDMAYLCITIIIDLTLIAGYIKLKNKIAKMEFKERNISIKEIKHNEKNLKKKIEKELENEEKKKWTKLANSFYVSEEYKKIQVNNKEIPFEKIVDVELLEDDMNVSKTTGNNKSKSKKHIAPIKAVIGGTVFGPVGAVIGGVSGKTTTNTKVNTITQNMEMCTNLSVKIQLSDIRDPFIIYKIITYKTNKNGFLYKNSYEIAQRCVSTVRAIINSNL